MRGTCCQYHGGLACGPLEATTTVSATGPRTTSLVERPSVTKSPCDATCVLEDENRRACREHIAAAVHWYSGRGNACALAHSAVLSDCPQCQGCALTEINCS